MNVKKKTVAVTKDVIILMEAMFVLVMMVITWTKISIHAMILMSVTVESMMVQFSMLSVEGRNFIEHRVDVIDSS